MHKFSTSFNTKIKYFKDPNNKTPDQTVIKPETDRQTDRQKKNLVNLNGKVRYQIFTPKCKKSRWYKKICGGLF